MNSKQSNGNYKHGLCGTKVYRAWQNMILRCYHKSQINFKDYGGRGIRICESIRSSVTRLVELIGIPEDGRMMTLNRIDNNGHYSCGECRECVTKGWKFNLEWTTYYSQMRNTRRSRRVVFDGLDLCVTDWAKRIGISEHALRHRLNKGMSPREALTTPVHVRMRRNEKRTSTQNN